MYLPIALISIQIRAYDMSRKSKNINQKGRSKWDGGQHLRLPYGMLRHPNFLSLSGSALKVMLFMTTKHTGFNNGKIALSYEDMAKALHISKATALRACEDLEYYGFMKLKKAGHFYGRKASEWEITFVESEGMPPSHEWKEAKPRLRARKAKPTSKTVIDEIFESPEYLESRRQKIEARFSGET